jgi:hypothetical protein
MSERVADATGPKIAVALPCANRSKMSTSKVDAARYVNGNVAKTSAPAKSSRRRPKTSDNAARRELQNDAGEGGGTHHEPDQRRPAPSSRANSGRRGVRQMHNCSTPRTRRHIDAPGRFAQRGRRGPPRLVSPA